MEINIFLIMTNMSLSYCLNNKNVASSEEAVCLKSLVAETYQFL